MLNAYGSLEILYSAHKHCLGLKKERAATCLAGGFRGTSAAAVTFLKATRYSPFKSHQMPKYHCVYYAMLVSDCYEHLRLYSMHLVCQTLNHVD